MIYTFWFTPSDQHLMEKLPDLLSTDNYAFLAKKTLV